MTTANITRSKVLIDFVISFEKGKKTCEFLHEVFNGRSVLGPNGKYYLVYESERENKNHLNVIKYEPKKISYIKYGEVESKFIFELNRWTKCYCYIKGGFVELNCFTEVLRTQVENCSAKLSIKYNLYMANSSIGTYNLNVTYKV